MFVVRRHEAGQTVENASIIFPGLRLPCILWLPAATKCVKSARCSSLAVILSNHCNLHHIINRKFRKIPTNGKDFIEPILDLYKVTFGWTFEVIYKI
jgi:hypothetical protein